MLGFGKTKTYREISPLELRAGLQDGSVLLVDVREPDEFASGHVQGAVNIPLSAFALRDIPDEPGRTIVLQCAGGKRSAMALDRCRDAQSMIDTHLAGGINAWTSAGLPLVRD